MHMYHSDPLGWMLVWNYLCIVLLNGPSYLPTRLLSFLTTLVPKKMYCLLTGPFPFMLVILYFSNVVM